MSAAACFRVGGSFIAAAPPCSKTPLRLFRRPRSIKTRIGYLVLLFILAGCAALSPVETTAPPPKFARIESTVPRWEPFARETAPGLDYFAGSIRQPRLDFRALRVDLTEPALKIIVNGDRALESGPVGGGLIPSTRVSSFTRRYGCLAGINTAPFDPVSGKEGEKRTIAGLAVSGGTVISPPHPSFDALVFYRDGGAAIVNQAAIADLTAIETAAGGFFTVLREGAVVERLLDEDGSPKEALPRHPRSAGGLSGEGNYLYLLVIDGRRPGSIGATEAETGILLKQLGSYEGINFDGGGSTALALKFPDGKVRVVNTPIHNRIPGRERGVAACLGILPAGL